MSKQERMEGAKGQCSEVNVYEFFVLCLSHHLSWMIVNLFLHPVVIVPGDQIDYL